MISGWSCLPFKYLDYLGSSTLLGLLHKYPALFNIKLFGLTRFNIHQQFLTSWLIKLIYDARCFIVEL